MGTYTFKDISMIKFHEHPISLSRYMSQTGKMPYLTMLNNPFKNSQIRSANAHASFRAFWAELNVQSYDML